MITELEYKVFYKEKKKNTTLKLLKIFQVRNVRSKGLIGGDSE